MATLRDTTIDGTSLNVSGDIIWGGEPLKDKILSRKKLTCENGELMIGNNGYLYEFIGGVGLYVGWALLKEITVDNTWNNMYSSKVIDVGLTYPKQFSSVTYANVSLESSAMWAISPYMYSTTTVPSFYALSASKVAQKDVYVSFLVIGFLG